MKEEIEELKDFTIDITDIDELALGLEVCSKKSNMVIQEFANLIIELQQENQALKKQLEEYKDKINWYENFEINKTIDKLRIKHNNQQKEFIEWLENGINQVRNTEFLDERIQRAGLVAYNRVLSKYKKIIGVPMAGLDDEEEPDLFEMIEDMKNKPKHIEEINKSYPIFNFDEKSFEAMKDMLQDVYEKQVEIIKSVNCLFDKDTK